MSWWEALILGTVQGLAEFLPISSSGHLVILRSLLGLGEIGFAFDTFLHLGSLSAVLFFFRKELWSLFRGGVALIFPSGVLASGLDPVYRRLAALVIAGSIPAAIAGFLLEPFFESLFTSPKIVGFALWVTAGIMWWTHQLTNRTRSADSLSVGRGLFIGLAQALAIIPGLSRSGSTIFAGVAVGLSRTAAVRFSFLLSVPVILGAGVSQIGKLLQLPDFTVTTALIGFLSAALAGFFAISALLRFINKRGTAPFAIYCAVIGLVTILLV